jgi:CheY-like chemotaxis protein
MKKILVAEDNDSNYVLMTYLLKKDFEFDRAVNGKVAVEMAEANAYDLILMDIKMPIMDGLEATRKIREKMPDLPIVALTANAFDSDRAAAEAAGCNGFLSKPVNRDECITLLKKILGE